MEWLQAWHLRSTESCNYKETTREVETMVKTKSDLIAYAMKISLPLMERAERRKRRLFTEINDNAGYITSWIEGFCRPLWGIAPILRDNGHEYAIQVDERLVPVCEWIRQTIIDGTNPDSEFYWDPYGQVASSSVVSNQIKTEMTGLLTGIYFAANVLWEPIQAEDRRRIADWIYNCSETAFQCCYPNNHYWFCVLNFLILKKLGYTYDKTDEYICRGLEKLDALYLGNGWYKDGEFGRFDYYIPWALHSYPLLWSLIEDESFDGYQERKAMYIKRTNDFLPYYAHYFDATGCHVPFGRSLSYRFAASAVFPMAIYAGCDFDPGLARNIVLKNINYFSQNVPLGDTGIFPPGFMYNAPGVIENYTSDGGPYWCAKAFWALLLPESHPFWQAPESPLPIEQGAYIKPSDHEDIHMVLVGDEVVNGVTLYNNSAHYLQEGEKRHFFNDLEAYYAKFAYNSRAGFGLSTRDFVSLDNMIGLVTKDRTMWSHRMGFQDLGEKNGMLESIHTPFSNDPETVIKTWLLPLSGGWHVRVHRVRLAREYYIMEGGFSVGLQKDFRQEESTDTGASVRTEQLGSAIYTAGSVPVRYFCREVQPGMHIMCPFAVYPCFETTESCQEGSYLFATVCGVFSRPHEMSASPKVYLDGSTVSIVYQDNTYRVETEKGN